MVILIISSRYIGALSPLEKAWEKSIAGVGAPIYAIFISIREFPAFHEKQELKKRIETLEQNLILDQELAVEVELLREENESLRALVEWSEDTAYPSVISKIIGRAVNMPSTNVIINKGRRDGVLEGLPVISPSDILIGIIVKTEEETSIVRMLNDSKSRISAKIVGSEEPVGLVVGELGFSLGLKFIPTDYQVKEGNIVVTSGMDSNIPDNLIIGTIASEPVKTDDFFKEAAITSVIPFSKITTVAVILPVK